MAPTPEPVPADGDSGANAALSILVVDADDRTRESVVGILGIRHRFNVVGSAGHVAEALAIARAHRPDVVILDPRLPEVSDGMVLIRRLRAIDAGVAILAVGWSPDLEHQALDAGADGFVRKTFKPGDLANAIARCMDSRLTEAADRIAAATARIARTKGGPALGAAAEDATPGTPAARPSLPAADINEPLATPVPLPGAGLIV